MTFIRSIVLLASVVLCVAFALFTGHGLATHELAPVLWGALLLALGAGLIFAQARLGRRT
jgi:hypothetical protein